MTVFLLILALGTFWFFPGLARALVALGLIGIVALAGWVVYDLTVRQPAKDAARAHVEAQEQAAALGERWSASARAASGAGGWHASSRRTGQRSG